MSHDTLLFLAKTLIAALIIAGASTLSQRNAVLAGYITALPLVTILALAFSYVQTRNDEAAANYALSVLAAVPVSLVFFVPFLFYSRLKGPFWLYLLVGIGLLYAGSYVHRLIAARLIG
jgi:hypothetical protein